MADSKISALPTNAGVTGDDLLLVVNDPAGTPTSQQVTISTLFGAVAANTVVNGTMTVNSNTFIVATASTPASASATGTAGQIAWDANYVYVCISTNTWKRTLLSTW